MTRQHLIGGAIRQPLFPLSCLENGFTLPTAQVQLTHKNSGDFEERFLQQQVTKTSNNVIDANSQKTQGNCSNSSRTKDDEHEFDLSFDEDFFLDIQKGGLELEDWSSDDAQLN